MLSTFSSALASRCTAARAWFASFQMPAAENAIISANIALVAVTTTSRSANGFFSL